MFCVCLVCLSLDVVLHVVIMGIFFTCNFVCDKWVMVVLIVSRRWDRNRYGTRL